MSHDCNVCRFVGAEEKEHIEHAHAVILVLMKRLREATRKIDRLKELFSQQKKNRLILGLSNEVGTLRGELGRARRELEEMRERMAAGAVATEGGLPEDSAALLRNLVSEGSGVEAGDGVR